MLIYLDKQLMYKSTYVSKLPELRYLFLPNLVIRIHKTAMTMIRFQSERETMYHISLLSLWISYILCKLFNLEGA